MISRQYYELYLTIQPFLEENWKKDKNDVFRHHHFDIFYLLWLDKIKFFKILL